MIDELESATKQIEFALMLLRYEREDWIVKAAVMAQDHHTKAVKALEALHADVMAWRCILIVAKREADRDRDLRRSLIGRAWHKLRATLL